MNTTQPRFKLGQLLITPGAQELLVKHQATPLEFLARHNCGDWGDLCDEDKHLNNLALVEGSRILSAYCLSDGEKFWIITEADRAVTTILLPSEY